MEDISVIVHDGGKRIPLKFNADNVWRSKGYKVTPKSLAKDAPYVITKGKEKIGEISYSLVQDKKSKSIHLWKVPGDKFELITYGNNRILSDILGVQNKRTVSKLEKILRPWITTIASITPGKNESGEGFLEDIASKAYVGGGKVSLKVNQEELIWKARVHIEGIYEAAMQKAGFKDDEIGKIVEKTRFLKSPVEIRNKLEIVLKKGPREETVAAKPRASSPSVDLK